MDLYTKQVSKELSKNRAVKIYKKILKGDLNRFPYGFWARNDNKIEDATACIRYLIEVELGLGYRDMKKITKKKLKTYRLGGMLKAVFNNNLYEAIDSVYKFTYFEWNLGRCGKSFWDREKGAMAIRDNIILKGWDREDVKEYYGISFYKETGLIHMLRIVFNRDIYEALESAYPGEYKVWELRRVPNSYWSEEKICLAVKWLIESVLKWDREDVKNKLCKKVFIENGLGGMLFNECGNSPYRALESAYPGEYKVWELKKVSKKAWSEENSIEAIKDMIEVKLKYSDEDIKKKLCRYDFKKCGYEYVLDKVFEGDVYNAVNKVYPGRYKRVQIKGAKGERKESLIVKRLQWYD